MTYAFYIRRSLAAGAGAGLAGLCAYYAYDYYQSVSAPIAVLVGALLLHLAESCRHERYYIRAGVFTALAATAVLISVIATVNRVAGIHDARVAEAKTQNLGGAQAGLSLEDAKAALAAAVAARESECGTGRGTQCRKKEDAEAAARAVLAPARQAVAAAGAQIVEDPGTRRLAAFLPVSEATIQLYQPLLLPVWLELTALATLTYGLAPPGRRPAPSPPLPAVPAAAPRVRATAGRPDEDDPAPAQPEPEPLVPVKPAPVASHSARALLGNGRSVLRKPSVARQGGTEGKPARAALAPPKAKAKAKPAAAAAPRQPVALTAEPPPKRGLALMLACATAAPPRRDRAIAFVRAWRAAHGGEDPSLKMLMSEFGLAHKSTASRWRSEA